MSNAIYNNLMAQLQDKNALFNVREEAIQTASGIIIPGKKSLINEATGLPMSVVSSTYRTVSNEEIFNSFLRNVVDSGIDATDAEFGKGRLEQRDRPGHCAHRFGPFAQRARHREARDSIRGCLSTDGEPIVIQAREALLQRDTRLVQNELQARRACHLNPRRRMHGRGSREIERTGSQSSGGLEQGERDILDLLDTRGRDHG